MIDSGKILVKSNEGKSIECDILFVFDSAETGKSYIVYTDNSLDELGNTKIYANIFNKDNESGELEEIETEEEWGIIEQIFSSVNSEKEGK